MKKAAEDLAIIGFILFMIFSFVLGHFTWVNADGMEGLRALYCVFLAVSGGFWLSIANDMGRYEDKE